MLNYAQLGKELYDLKKPREFRRYLNLVARAYLHSARLRYLEDFFASNPTLSRLAQIYPYFYEQPTRAFFYNKSKFKERVGIVKNHVKYLTERVKEDVLVDIYAKKPQILWQSKDEGEPLILKLAFHKGFRKEGLLALLLDCPAGGLYKTIFWFSPNEAGEPSLYIGALQGPHFEGAKEAVKQITKRCHAYRTKNLILHATQEFARALGVSRIYAVTNYGYYAMNHIRADRKLKTDFGDFWNEAGGKLCKDKRFYELPLVEARKSMDEIQASKRASYRRRYELLDEIDDSIATSSRAICK